MLLKTSSNYEHCKKLDADEMFLYWLQLYSYRITLKINFDIFCIILPGHCSDTPWRDQFSSGVAHHSSMNDIEGHSWLEGTSQSPQIFCMGWYCAVKSHISC